MTDCATYSSQPTLSIATYHTVARIDGVSAHAAARARADASFVLGIGCMTAFRGPKQVDTARSTLQKLEETCDLMTDLFGYMQQPGR